MTGGHLIRIQYQPWKKELTKSQFVDFADQAMRAHGKAFAAEIADKFSEWLSPGYTKLHKNPIGASGRASDSFKFDGATRRGVSTYYVMEGSTAARKIRIGLQPGVAVSLGALKLWAARKGLKLLSSAEYKQKYGSKDTDKSAKWTFGKVREIAAYTSTSAKGNAFDVKTHGRAEKGKTNVVNSALKAIANALLESGTDRPGANWMAYFPKAQGHFDYPRYLFTARKRTLEKIAGHHADGTADALVSFWNSGGTIKVLDFNTLKLRSQRKTGLF